MRGNAVFITAVLALLMISAGCIAGTVRLQNDSAKRTEEARYVQLEREYVREMQTILNTEGFINSGVMLTRTVYEDNSREYHIAIHHGRFDSLSTGEKEALVEELKSAVFEEEDCSFIYSLTGNA
ncbi:MAG: hypothetical protein J1E83_04665 [Lachnospiraceae bacterium]|nr:hypothetical protein [Lachnospiraceae bacterium]